MTESQRERSQDNPLTRIRVGILGGTFDPIHFGHLFIAAEASQRFQLDKVLFIPNGNPPHKMSAPVTAAHHRTEMIRIATESNPQFRVSDIEIKRDGPSYTIDTLVGLRAERPDADFYYIAGADTIADLLTWHRHSDLMEYAVFVALSRPGFSQAGITDRLPAAYVENVRFLESPALGISSTEIRRRIAGGYNVRYLLPDTVLEYIATHSLYRETAGPE